MRKYISPSHQHRLLRIARQIIQPGRRQGTQAVFTALRRQYGLNRWQLNRLAALSEPQLAALSRSISA